MIPISILSKMGIYELEIHGVKVTVNLVDDARLINDYVAELRSRLKKPIVGYDVKFQHHKDNSKSPELLILCVGNRCLIIQLPLLPLFPPDKLDTFLDDDGICFVGTGMNTKVPSLRRNCRLLATGCWVDVGELAARVLQKTSLMGTGCGRLAEVATEVGVKFEPPTDHDDASWKSKFEFTDEEIKNAIYEAYTCYVIGNKLLGQLGI